MDRDSCIMKPGTKQFLNASQERIASGVKKNKVKNWTRAFFELYQEEPLRRRQAMSLSYALVNEPVLLFENELLVGQLYTQPACDLGGADIDKRWELFDCNYSAIKRTLSELPEIAEFTGENIAGSNPSWISFSSCSPGHIGWHWDWIIRDGVDALLQRIIDAMDSADEDGREFLDGCRITLNALLEWNERHIASLENAVLREDDSIIKSFLERKLDICRRVPRYGARSFHEALQAFHISYLATMFENPYGGNSPGRLDYFLWPFLEQDIATGLETLETARDKIDELFIRFYERNLHQDMGVETIVVAGSTPDGRSAYNPLSKIMIESITALKTACPSIYIRMPENPSDELIDIAAGYMINGCNTAQILNDKAIVRAMTENSGMDIEDARMYLCGGCMEISPQGMNSDLVFSGFFNVPKVLELVINGGICLNTGKKILTHLNKTLADYTSFEDFYQVFIEELQRSLILTFKMMDIHSEEFARLRPGFLISSQIENCIERARGINAGGAKYEDYGSTPLGLPNTGDCLTAIKTAVFDEKLISSKELLHSVQQNFQGLENLRLMLLKLPKFGQGNHAADAMVNRVLNSTCDIYDSFRNRFNGRVKPMIMSFVFSPVAGMALGATADGHFAGTPVAQGLTPQNGSMINGITSAIISANSLDLHRVSGGATSMWDLDPQIALHGIVRSLIEGFIQSGGQIYQGNTTDVEILKKAMENSHEYSDVIVRVGGFSARFTGLPEDVQNEIISRYRHTG